MSRARQASKTGEHVAGLSDIVKLDPDHPGFRDPVYRARRNQIARIALDHVIGDPVPRIAYADDEHRVWATVWKCVAPLHGRFACREYLEGSALLNLDRQRIPQLADVNQILTPRTGFRMLPVAGLVASRIFQSQLGNDVFLATQYIRHASVPLYTPEPDIVHELIGHAATFCQPTFARLNRLFGEAAARVADTDLVTLERLYWYTLEFGLVLEDGVPKAYGAGLLSSFGELERFMASAHLEEFNPDAAAARPYDPTDYQHVLYVVPSLDALHGRLATFLASK